MASDSKFQPTLRLHAASWLFALSGALKQLILPLIALVFFGVRDDDPTGMGRFILPAIIAALLVRAVWHQWTYRYGFDAHALVIREGLIFRNVRQIEYARIENIDTERGLLHRLLGVAEVRVHTSTGGKPEASISVLDLDAVRAMRARVFSETQTPAMDDPARDAILLHRPIGELVRYGLIDNRGMLLVAAGVGLLHQSGLLVIDRQTVARLLEQSATVDLAALSLVMQVSLAVMTVIGALISVRILSIVLAIVTFYEFRLTRHEGDLRARYGLLTRVGLTLRTRRIQAIHQTETLLHRWFKRVSLNVDLAGDGSEGEDQRDSSKMRTRWLAPVCPPDTARALMAIALPSIDWNVERDWQPLARGARGRIFRRGLMLSVLILAAPAIWYLHEGAIVVALICLPLVWMHAHLYTKYTRWALAHDAVLFRSGWLTRRLTVVPRDRVQTLSVEASPFDRRSRMANIYIDTAGASSSTAGIRIRYLAIDVAERLAAALYRSAGAKL